MRASLRVCVGGWGRVGIGEAFNSGHSLGPVFTVDIAFASRPFSNRQPGDFDVILTTPHDGHLKVLQCTLKENSLLQQKAQSNLKMIRL